MIFPLTFKRPVLIVGNGVRFANAESLLRKFELKTDIPVVTSMNAVDLVQGESKLGFIGVYGNRIANAIVAESDLIIAIGVRLGLRQIGNDPELFAPKAHLIRVDIDKYELSRYIKPDEDKHLLDAKDFLSRLLLEEIPKYTQWKNKCFEAKQLLNNYDKDVGNLCVEKISTLLPKDPIISIDVGQNQCWSAQSFTLKGHLGRMLIAGGYGSMGCALPYAIGAAIAVKDNVYCVTGDGGLQMNIQELQTVVREKLPIKILVLNNRVLGKISEIQSEAYNKKFAQTTASSGYTVPDFEKVSQAYGIKAVTLSSYEMLDAYKHWLTDKEPCLINIILPEDSRLIPKIHWNSSEMLPSIDHEAKKKLETIFQ